MLRFWTLLLMLIGLLGPSVSRAETTTDYELTVAVVKQALKGWELFQTKQFAASFQDGQYTDPDPQTRSHDFWTNERYAKLDRDGNGHHETIFLISGGELVYVGSIGQRGRFVDVSGKFQAYEGEPITAFINGEVGRL